MDGVEEGMVKEDLAALAFPPDEIEEKTEAIYRQILLEPSTIDKANFERIGTKDLRRLFELYDQSFFDGFFLANYREKLFFHLSQRMTSAGGKTTYAKRTGTFTISLSTALIFQTFRDVQREVTVNGIVCHDRLQAAMRILEHEIVHLIELALFGCSSCKQARFRRLSRDLFGHTDVTHRLVTQAERAREMFRLSPGDEVQFDWEGKRYRGVLHRITRRATVMVKDPKGAYADARGTRYAKYYVLLSLLQQTDGSPDGAEALAQGRRETAGDR